ncbi:hypothetical protein ACFL3O_01840, partial [Candidatus Neomarinimicrobiota bacterium]
KPEISWSRVLMTDIGSIDLPPNMEIQAGEFKKFNDVVRDEMTKYIDFVSNEPKLVFQPKGLNDLTETSFDKYARVIVQKTNGNPGDYEKLSTQFELSDDEMKDLNDIIENQHRDGFANTSMKIIQWYPVNIVEINGMTSVKISYTRKIGDNPAALVEIYRFQNYDNMISLTTSYKISEKNEWYNNLQKAKNSFRITNIK